jgi:hypothetical protein
MDEEIRFRLAHVNDAQQLAKVHWATSLVQPGGYMYRLGRGFLTQYYKISLEEKNSVVLCAEINGEIIGVVSGSLDSQEHAAALKNRRLQLFLGALPALIRHPGLIKGMLSRQDSISGSANQKSYIVLSGVRLEYWGWLPNHKSFMGAVPLLQNWLRIMHFLGARSIIHEVDKENERSYQIHTLLGSKIIMEYITGDGKTRLLMEYILDEEELMREAAIP